MGSGTHTYPLSFTLPSTLPPTAHYPHSSTTYKLKASVHRPGVLTPKIKTSREVFLVSCPIELEGDEGEAGPEDVAGLGNPGGAVGAPGGPPPPFGAVDGADGHSGEGVSGVGGGAINVEREWDNALRYRIEFGRRKIEMGGWMDLRIMLMPMEKVRIWRIGVYLEGFCFLPFNNSDSLICCWTQRKSTI
jgi:arrestin-related trafficking adapter 3/6